MVGWPHQKLSKLCGLLEEHVLRVPADLKNVKLYGLPPRIEISIPSDSTAARKSFSKKLISQWCIGPVLTRVHCKSFICIFCAKPQLAARRCRKCVVSVAMCNAVSLFFFYVCGKEAGRRKKYTAHEKRATLV